MGSIVPAESMYEYVRLVTHTDEESEGEKRTEGGMEGSREGGREEEKRAMAN